MRNQQLRPRTLADIDAQVMKVLRGIGSPEPPLGLDAVRELLRLDRQYYSTTDDGLLRETISRLKIAGLQVLKRPTLLAEAVRTLSLKALYLPDQKRILLDQDLPAIKHRWNEAHEIGHDIIPWHPGMMGDTEQTLTLACHEQMEGEANYAAGRLLFLGPRFAEEARSSTPSLREVQALSKRYGNTMTSTLWRYVEQAHRGVPMLGMVSAHPHRTRRAPDFNPAQPCRYLIESESFAQRFAISDTQAFSAVASYCGAQRGGPLGAAEVALYDLNHDAHAFTFETFFNGHEALTLGVYLRPVPIIAAAQWTTAATTWSARPTRHP